MPAPLHLLGAQAVSRAAAAGPGAASRSTRRSRACPICWPSKLAALSRITRWRRRRCARSSARCRCAASRRRATRWRVEIFDFQARALGLHVANLAMALDPQFVVIGGGLMDPEATTEAFRERYLRIIARDRGSLSLAGPARSHQRHARGARRPVAGDRRGPGRAVSRSRPAAPNVRRRRPFVDNGGKRRQRISETKQRRKRRRTEKSPRRH